MTGSGNGSFTDAQLTAFLDGALDDDALIDAIEAAIDAGEDDVLAGVEQTRAFEQRFQWCAGPRSGADRALTPGHTRPAW